MNVVYGLRCSCHPEMGIRYVGFTSKGLERRFNEHLWESNRRPTLPKHHWMLKHGVENILIVPLEDLENMNDLPSREMDWIAKLRLEGAQLLNMTIGGEGRVGYTATPESRQKMSLAKLGKSTGPKSEQVRLKISEGLKKTFKHHEGDKPKDSKAKFSYEQADEIRTKNLNGVSQRGLSREYGVSLKAIQNILNGVTYRQG